MFTGLVQSTGVLLSVSRTRRNARLALRLGARLRSLKKGESLAVNGVCLTLAKRRGTTAVFDLSPETLKRTTLGELPSGSRLNLERPLRRQDRFGGHFVLGHADGIGAVREVRRRGRCRDYRIAFPRPLAPFFVFKGSVAVDGVSLTVGKKTPGFFWTHCVPETLRRTTLAGYRKGTRVNLEADLLSKLVKRKDLSKISRSKRLLRQCIDKLNAA